MSRTSRSWAGALPALVATAVLFGGAVAGTVAASLQPDPFSARYALAAWRRVLADPAFATAVAFTLAVTAATTLVSVALAVPVAAALRGRGWARTLTALPVLVPHLLVATVVVLWLGPGGLAERLVGGLPVDLVRSRWGLGIVLVYVVKEVPFLALLVLASWDDEIAAREEAAAVHGAGRVARFRHVVLPGVRGPLVVGSLVVAAFVLGSFEVPLVVGPTRPDTIATYALRVTQVADLSGRAAAAAALLIATAGSLLLAAAAGLLVRGRHG